MATTGGGGDFILQVLAAALMCCKQWSWRWRRLSGFRDGGFDLVLEAVVIVNLGYDYDDYDVFVLFSSVEISGVARYLMVFLMNFWSYF